MVEPRDVDQFGQDMRWSAATTKGGPNPRPRPRARSKRPTRAHARGPSASHRIVCGQAASDNAPNGSALEIACAPNGNARRPNGGRRGKTPLASHCWCRRASKQQSAMSKPTTLKEPATSEPIVANKHACVLRSWRCAWIGNGSKPTGE